jgi:hypothetical protein
MATNILSLPLAHLTVVTGNNEDWIDTILYLVTNADGTPGPQLDLRGISFDMEIRSQPPAHEVILRATTDDGSLSVGAPPNVGYLIFYVPLAVMQYRAAGDYVGDIRARDGQFDRVALTLDLTILEGVTK